MIGYIT